MTNATTTRAAFLSLALAATLSVLAGLHGLSSNQAHAAWAQAQAAARQA